MKFTLSWLKQHLLTNASVAQLSEALTAIGIEVEQIIDKSKIYKYFVIAEILSASQHPEAYKLKVCQVSDGKNTFNIVCGAPNAKAGIKVVMAPVGSIIPANNLIIKAAKIRGIESHGMLCSYDELVLEGDSGGIIELPGDAPVGSKFAEYAKLNEIIFDVAITPNRGDLASIAGIARDLSAYGLGDLISPKPIDIATNKKPTPVNIIIEDKENCSQFALRLISNISITAQDSLVNQQMRAVGSSMKNTLVNISNYSMLEYGRPNHCYDADKIKGDVIIRKSKEGEKFIALGPLELILPAGLLVVADEEKVLALAGVIGGESSKIDDNTKNILVEVANFNPLAVTIAGRNMNVITDSRFRFERRIDFENTEFFMQYLTNQITTHCGGEVYEIKQAQGNAINYAKEVKFSLDKLEQVAGFVIEPRRINEILNKLGFQIIPELAPGKESIIKIPSWRQGDVERDVDIIEEILRIYGYDNIPIIPLPININDIETQEEKFSSKARKLLTMRNFNEVITWSFISENTTDDFGFKDSIKLENPISIEMSIMRQSILPGLLKTAQDNAYRGLINYNFFEIGNIYDKAFNNSQQLCIAAIRVGMFEPKTMFKTERPYDFYDIKSDIFALIEEYGLDTSKLTIKNQTPSYYHPGISATFMLGNNVIGYCGQLHPKIIKKFDISNTLALELFLDKLPAKKIKHAKSKMTFSNLQAINRDFAFVMANDVLMENVIRQIKSVDNNLIEAVKVFDIYQGNKIEIGQKSVAISVTIRPEENTMTDSEIEQLSKKIIDSVTVQFNARLRYIVN